MKVIEHLKRAEQHGKTLVSFEVTPPEIKKDKEHSFKDINIEGILNTIEQLRSSEPSFIDVTYHPVRLDYEETEEGIEKVLITKRPGTRSVCSHIQRDYKIDAVAHVLCRGFSKGEVRDYLSETKFDNVHNIFVIHGDDTGYERPPEPGIKIYNHPSEMIPQIRKDFCDFFCIGVAGYPEKHYAAPNMETDLEYLKQKVDAGADYIITQMFFDNEKYFKFLDRCRKSDINVPIIPGIKVIIHGSQLTSVPKRFHVDIPYELSERIRNADKKDVYKLGIEHATKQAEDLIKNRIPILHFFVYEKKDPEAVMQIFNNLEFSKNS